MAVRSLHHVVGEESALDNPSPMDLGETERSMGVAYSVIAVAVLGAAGYALDGWLGTRPWLAVVGLVIGAVIALVGIRTLIGNHARS
jgi:F0F1-type ATP synthase assembly protein I